MRQLVQLGRKRNLADTSLRATVFGLLSALATLSLAKTPPRYEGDGPVMEVPPFVGTHSETWEEFPVGEFGSPEVSILGGTAVISGTELEIATTHMFHLCGFDAEPTDGAKFMGADAASASVSISFSQPVSAFGAYWGNIPEHPQGCGGTETHFNFMDITGNLVGQATYPAGNGAMHWRGFAFTTPVKTIDVDGIYLVTDGMQATVASANPLLNISTRLRVETGDNSPIGGFIITGNAAKDVALRGIGPSLAGFGVTDPLADPTLELRDSSGMLLFQNDNWQDDPAQASQLSALGLAPQDPNESGIVATLQPGASYTAILAGKNNGTGTGLVEVYDTNQGAGSQLSNISTRGFVETGTNVMIGGFILGGSGGSTSVVVRGIGPSLSQAGVSDVLADPTLELRDSNATLLASNDNWQDDAASAAQLTAYGLAPQNSLESGIFATLPSGAFTVILEGKNGGVGVGLVEVYDHGAP